MVSFLDNPQEKGRMVKALESFGITPLQFCLDAKRPDLTRLDKLLGMLCSETEFFIKKSKKISNLLKNKTFSEALEYSKIKKIGKKRKGKEVIKETPLEDSKPSAPLIGEEKKLEGDVREV